MQGICPRNKTGDKTAMQSSTTSESLTIEAGFPILVMPIWSHVHACDETVTQEPLSKHIEVADSEQSTSSDRGHSKLDAGKHKKTCNYRYSM